MNWQFMALNVINLNTCHLSQAYHWKPFIWFQYQFLAVMLGVQFWKLLKGEIKGFTHQSLFTGLWEFNGANKIKKSCVKFYHAPQGAGVKSVMLTSQTWSEDYKFGNNKIRRENEVSLRASEAHSSSLFKATWAAFPNLLPTCLQLWVMQVFHKEGKCANFYSFE